MTACVMCSAGLHTSCLRTSCDCNHLSLPTVSVPTITEESVDDDAKSNDETRHSTRNNSGRGPDTSSRGNTRSGKRDATLKDQQSTGRKRAARLYPLDRESSCEWKNLANCGGGTQPILGCILGKQEARHHGPDKSTSNNEEGNVHRICHACHNRWHAANNAEYNWNDTTVKKHDPRPQTAKEQEEAMLVHMTYAVKKRIKD